MERGIRHGLLLLLVATTACGPDKLSDAESAIQHEIHVQRVGRIGDAEGPGMLRYLTRESLLRDGRIALWDRFDPGRVKLYELDGRFLGAFGREGDGPGEFRRPIHHFLVPTEDTLVIIDPSLGRISLWSPDGSELYDTDVLPGGQGGLRFLEDGRIVVNTPTVDPEGRNVPLRLVTRAGETIRPLGQPFRTDLPFEVRAHVRHLSPGEDGTIWSAPLFEYRLEQWDTLGNLVSELNGDHIEMPPPEDAVVGRPSDAHGDPPTPWVQGIWYDPGPHVLWVAVAVPREEWRDRLPEPGSGTYPSDFYPENSWTQTRLEAWGLERGEVLASSLLEERWSRVIGPGFAASHDADSIGNPVLDIWRATLEPRR